MFVGFFLGLAVALGLATYSLSPSNEGLEHRKALENPQANFLSEMSVPNNINRSLEKDWWKKASFYHIYLRSFKDSNGDGIGDLPGLISRLDYLSDTLGIDAIWLSPIHPSPNNDFGYDVSDYYNIHQDFGNLSDFDKLIHECKRRNIKVILDLVVNHTSDQHAWFLESKKSLDNPKRNWYLWRTGKNKKEVPNNWQARPAGGGSAWKYDATTDQYYLRSFLDSQPDLNWRNEEVRAEIRKIMEFWLEKGVAGFRLDIANYYLKDEHFRDNPASMLRTFGYGACLGYEYQAQEHIYDKNNPALINIFRDMRKVADIYNAVLLGEIDDEEGHIGNTMMSALAYGPYNDGLHLAFNFDILKAPPTAVGLRSALDNWYERLPAQAQPVCALSNHDKERLISRLGNNEQLAKLLALWQLSFNATPVIYYGDEIGMRHTKLALSDQKDQLHAKAPYLVRSFIKDRDGARTPMQWKNTVNAGFSKTQSWLPVDDNKDLVNVKNQQKQTDSLLSLYRTLLALRKEHASLHAGDLNFIDGPAKVLLYERRHEYERHLIALNFSNEQQLVSLNNKYQCVFSTLACDKIYEISMTLEPYEGVILWEK